LSTMSTRPKVVVQAKRKGFAAGGPAAFSAADFLLMLRR
jgi:hypothetical protein